MPIYLVRWPGLSAALVRAGSEDELLHILDEVGNPEGCTWREYRGPLFVELSLDASFELRDRGDRAGPLTPLEIAVGDVSGLREGTGLRATIPGGDTAFEMAQSIERWAFPHVFCAREQGGADPRDEDLRQAVAAELEALIRASWRYEHLRRAQDPEGELAAQMAVPRRLLRWWQEAAGEPEGEPSPAGPAPQKPTPLAPLPRGKGGKGGEGSKTGKGGKGGQGGKRRPRR